MRTAFIRALEEMAEKDDRVTLIVGDLGFGVIETFARRFPQRYLNAGVAEQNMTGIAAGMALMGKVVFTYSIGNFPTLRCLEQVRNDVCYHNANVKIVVVGGGLAYGSLGMTHHATEDIAIMRALPNMVVISPCDPVEAAAATRAVVQWPGPCYLRLGRAGEPTVHQTPINFQIGRAIQVTDGDDLTLIATGGIITTAIAAANRLLEQGISTRVLSMHTIKPLDADAVLAAARETSAVATIEEHSIIGGLGSAVAQVLAEADGPKVPFTTMGLQSAFAKVAGDQTYLRESSGLSIEAVTNRLLKLVARRSHA
ncbi:MAG: transketolase [Chloroflexi bacterium]|nr:transketolase [Chloroflexota bacterium]